MRIHQEKMEHLDLGGLLKSIQDNLQPLMMPSDNLEPFNLSEGPLKPRENLKTLTGPLGLLQRLNQESTWPPMKALKLLKPTRNHETTSRTEPLQKTWNQFQVTSTQILKTFT